MSDTSLQSPRLALPFIAPAQAQKHITHNEALSMLDTLCHLSALSQQSSPPESPQTGDLYIIESGSTGIWANKDGQIAQFAGLDWHYYIPQTGWVIWREDSAQLMVFADEIWQVIIPEIEAATESPLFGINAAADTQNRLIVKSPNTLLDNEDGDHRLKINKSQAADTASILFQSAYQGQAEMGLAGDNAFRIKISMDGTNWSDAVSIDNNNGHITLNGTVSINGHAVHHDGNAPQALAYQGLIAGVEDLDTYDTTGIWHQNANSKALAGTHYPAPWAGLLTVVEALPMVYQTYQTYASAPHTRNATFTRGRYNAAWSPWKRLDNP